MPLHKVQVPHVTETESDAENDASSPSELEDSVGDFPVDNYWGQSKHLSCSNIPQCYRHTQDSHQLLKEQFQRQLQGQLKSRRALMMDTHGPDRRQLTVPQLKEGLSGAKSTHIPGRLPSQFQYAKSER